MEKYLSEKNNSKRAITIKNILNSPNPYSSNKSIANSLSSKNTKLSKIRKNLLSITNDDIKSSKELNINPLEIKPKESLFGPANYINNKDKLANINNMREANIEFYPELNDQKDKYDNECSSSDVSD